MFRRHRNVEAIKLRETLSRVAVEMKLEMILCGVLLPKDS
jgi:hypothetical protein